MKLFVSLMLGLLALFAAEAWATQGLTVLSFTPIVATWINVNPDDSVIYIANEAVHLKYIAGRVSSPTAAASNVLVYKVADGVAPCSKGVPMMAAGKFFDAAAAPGTRQLIPLGTDVTIPLGTALCIVASGDFSMSKASMTIGLGP